MTDCPNPKKLLKNWSFWVRSSQGRNQFFVLYCFFSLFFFWILPRGGSLQFIFLSLISIPLLDGAAAIGTNSSRHHDQAAGLLRARASSTRFFWNRPSNVGWTTRITPADKFLSFACTEICWAHAIMFSPPPRVQVIVPASSGHRACIIHPLDHLICTYIIRTSCL